MLPVLLLLLLCVLVVIGRVCIRRRQNPGELDTRELHFGYGLHTGMHGVNYSCAVYGRQAKTGRQVGVDAAVPEHAIIRFLDCLFVRFRFKLFKG